MWPFVLQIPLVTFMKYLFIRSYVNSNAQRLHEARGCLYGHGRNRTFLSLWNVPLGTADICPLFGLGRSTGLTSWPRIKSFGAGPQCSPVKTNPQVTVGQSQKRLSRVRHTTPKTGVFLRGSRGEAEGREQRRQTQTLPPPQFTGGHPGRCPGVWGRPGPLHPSVPLESVGPGQTHPTGLKATALVLLPHSQTLVAGLGIARGAR